MRILGYAFSLTLGIGLGGFARNMCSRMASQIKPGLGASVVHQAQQLCFIKSVFHICEAGDKFFGGREMLHLGGRRNVFYKGLGEGL